MLDYKIHVKSNLEIQQAISLFELIGYVPITNMQFYIDNEARYFFAESNKFREFGGEDYVVEWCTGTAHEFFEECENQEITIDQLITIAENYTCKEVVETLLSSITAE